jgi:hypothetical protein
MQKTAALFLVLAATAAMAGEIYMWKDSSGRVHYSDTPPPGQSNARAVRSSPDPAPKPAPAASQAAQPGTAAPAGQAAAPKQKSIAEQDLEFRQRRAQADEARAKAEKEQAAAEEKRRSCESARNQLAALESGQRIARFNEKGEREFLEDAQRATEVERMRKVVADACK